MGIQINGQTDTITATDGSLTVSGADLGSASASSLNISGIVTASGGVVVAAGTTAAPSISPTGDSNTGIFFPSADTIAFGEGGVEVARINSSGNVGIGTDNPTVFGTAYRTLQLNPAAGTGDGSAIRFMYDGGAANTNDLVIYTNSSQSYIRANGARNLDIMRNGSTVATFNANGIALPSGLGIDFSATSNSSGTTTSELLDDYEEGTWTPQFLGHIANPVYTASTAYGHYTKIGNTVHCWGLIVVSAVASNGSGNWWLDGFPFISSTGMTYAQVGLIGYNDVQTNEVNKFYMNSNTTYAVIVPNGVTQSNETYNSNAITTGYFGFTVTYKTDS